MEENVPTGPSVITMKRDDVHKIFRDLDMNHRQLDHACRRVGEEWVMTIHLDDLPVSFVEGLITNNTDAELKATAISYMGRSRDELLDTAVQSPGQLCRNVEMLQHKAPVYCRCRLNGRDYFVPLSVEYYSTFFGEEVACRTSASICDYTRRKAWYVDGHMFKDTSGSPINKSVRAIFAEIGADIGPETTAPAEAEHSERANQMEPLYGMVVDVSTDLLVLVKTGWWDELVSVSFGTVASPRQVIVERVLESERDDDERRAGRHPLPMLRVFAPDLKRYGYIDVDDVRPHVFDRTARERIVLSPKDRRVLDAIFESKQNEVFGDLFHNRHGGLIVMAAGPPGTGKTLAAEVFAEYMERPLYCMNMGEIGADLISMEKNLQLIFTRAKRWNAVLLLDEADILLYRRGEDVERSAMVGVFLRLLDQYEGTFFLTTNRREVIDLAFRSRITATLTFPALDNEKRTKVWQQLLDAAKLQYSGNMDALGELVLNGRNIRSCVRLLRLLNPGVNEVTLEHVHDALQYVDCSTG